MPVQVEAPPQMVQTPYGYQQAPPQVQMVPQSVIAMPTNALDLWYEKFIGKLRREPERWARK